MYNENLVVEYFERTRNEKIDYIERNLKVEPMKGKAISIIGPRRAGKTFFLLNKFLQRPNHSIYLDIESIEFSKTQPEDILKIIGLYETRYNTKIDKMKSR